MFPPFENPDFNAFFAPPPQADAPPPDSFDKEFGEVDFDWLFQQPELEYIHSTLYQDPVTSTPSTTTYSTDYSQDSSSQYSIDFGQSDYSIPSDVVPNGPGYIMDNSHSLDIFYDSSSRSASAYSDYGPSDLSGYGPSFELPPADLSLAMQDPAITTGIPPTLAPAEVTIDAQAKTSPTKPFKCPHCSQTSARKWNLKTHIDTHYKGKPKKHVCSVCLQGFSRKHDLKRHRSSLHGDHRPLQSARRKSARASERAIGAPEEIIPWMTEV